MKKLVVKALALIASLYVVDVSAGIVLDFLRDHAPDGRYQKATYTLCHATEDIIILGSSKGESNLIPAVIEKNMGQTCWNASRGGQGLPYFQAITNAILHRHVPKLVLLNLEPDILSTPLKFEKAGFLRPYYSKTKSIQEVLDSISPTEWIFNHSRLYQYNSSFYYLLRPYFFQGLDGNSEQKGWKPRSGTVDKHFKRTYIKKLVDRKSLNYKAVEMLKNIAEDYILHGSTVCFVVSPDYGEVTSFSRSLEKIKEIANNLKIPVLDYSNREDYAKREDLFVDIQHLNSIGALEFTYEILDELKNTPTSSDISIKTGENKNFHERASNTEVY